MFSVKRICKNMSCALSAFPSKPKQEQSRQSKNPTKSSKHEYVAQCANSTLSVIDKLKYVQSSKKRYVKSMFRDKRKIIYMWEALSAQDIFLHILFTKYIVCLLLNISAVDIFFVLR